MGIALIFNKKVISRQLGRRDWVRQPDTVRILGGRWAESDSCQQDESAVLKKGTKSCGKT